MTQRRNKTERKRWRPAFRRKLKTQANAPTYGVRPIALHKEEEEEEEELESTIKIILQHSLETFSVIKTSQPEWKGVPGYWGIVGKTSCIKFVL